MQQVEQLLQARYIALTTFRRNGRAVTTPVWVAAQDSKLYVYTGRATGKLKRIRHNQTVQVAPSNAIGQTQSSFRSAQARILSGSEAQQAELLLQQKYG